MRFRSPFDDDVDVVDLAMLVVFLLLIGGLVAWAVSAG